MRALWGLVLLSACGVHYDNTTTRGVACNDLAVAICDKAVSCNFLLSRDRAGCVSDVVGGCCGTNHTCGDVVFNPDGAAGCVNRLHGDDCSAIGTATMASLPGYCQQMF